MEEYNDFQKPSEVHEKSTPSERKPVVFIIMVIATALLAYIYYSYVYGKSEVMKAPPLIGVPADKIAPLMGSYAPNFTLKDLNGKEVTLSDYRGKVVFLNLWATWCPPCREEMPSMQKLYEKFQRGDFEILAVSIDVSEAKVVAPFMKELGLTFPALLDPKSKVGRLYRITGVPETFIIHKNGIIVKKIIGPMDWSTESSMAFFNRLIREDP